MAGDTFYKELDYPDVGDCASFFAVQDVDDPCLWHGVYELSYRSSWVYGDGTPEFELGRRDIRVPADYMAEDYLAEACDDGEAPGIPADVFGKWQMDYTLCDLAEQFDSKEMTLREMLAEYEDGNFAGDHDALAAFAKANRWAFRVGDGD